MLHTMTRRRPESAYIRQVNFLQLLRRVGEGDGAPLKLNLYLKPFSKYRNNGHERHWDHDLDLSRSRYVIIRSALGHFLLVVNWYQVSILSRFQNNGLKDIGITTLTFHGHVTSSMTSSFDTTHAISYRCPIVTRSIWSHFRNNGP